MHSFNNKTNSCEGRRAVIYARISTDRQNREGDGLRSQTTTCQEFAKREGLEVVEVFSDVISGKFAARPGMEAMLKFLRAHQGENLAVIIDDISRLARDLMSYLVLRDEIADAGGELKSPKMEFSDDPIAQLPERMMAVIVEHERVNNARRSSERMKARLTNGYWCFPAPAGYVFTNDPAGGGKVLARSEPAASALAEALELFASGQLSTQAELRRHLEADPRFPKGKTGKVHKQRIRDMLTNPLYAGYLAYEPWSVGFTKARHAPLISLKAYDRIQQRLAGRPVFPVRKAVNEDFPLRGFVCCNDCGKPYRGGKSTSRSGKRYAYYVCQTQSCASYGKSVPKQKLEERFEDLMADLVPRPELVAVAKAMFSALWKKHLAAFEERRAAAKASLKAIDRKIETLVGRVVNATQPALITAYEGEITKLERQRVLESERLAAWSTESGAQTPDIESAYRTALGFLANPLNLWRSERIECRRLAVRLTFLDKLNYCRKTGYRTPAIALPFRVFGDLTAEGSSMVRVRRLELPRVAPLEPKSSASTNSATPATLVLLTQVFASANPLIRSCAATP